MAKLPEPFNVEVIAAEAAWREGRYDEAMRLIAEHLASEAPLSRDFRELAAKALRAAIEANLKRKQEPPRWFEVGNDFETLHANGMSKTEAYKTLSEKYGKGFRIRNIRTAIAYYQKCRKAHDDCLRAELKAHSAGNSVK